MTEDEYLEFLKNRMQKGIIKVELLSDKVSGWIYRRLREEKGILEVKKGIMDEDNYSEFENELLYVEYFASLLTKLKTKCI